MFHNLLFNSARGLGILLAAATCLLSPGTGGDAQQPASAALHFKVERRIERLEMTVNYSRILTMDGSIPRAQVANPSIVKLTPLSRNQIQIAALKAWLQLALPSNANLFDRLHLCN